MRWVLSAVGLLAAVFVLFAVLQSTPPSPEEQARRLAEETKRQSRDAISLCWQDYERKSLDPPTKRFVAGTCEMMEQKFIGKYGHKP